jgi:menaquinone-9 beta-reductase
MKGAGMKTVVVIGGGPSGCIAAASIARNGIDVHLLERGERGRDKACGDMFLPSAVMVLNRFGLNEKDFVESGGVKYRNILTTQKGNLIWSSDYQSEGGWILPRKAIDQKMRDNLPSNVHVVYSATALSITQIKSNSIRIIYSSGTHNITLMAEAVVIACGSRNSLAINFGIDGDAFYGVAVSAYCEGVDSTDPTFDLRGPREQGYYWTFPLGKRISNIGICVLNNPKSTNLKAIGDIWATGLAAKRLTGWRGGISRLWSGRANYWHSTAGIVSCGDAAGLVDPITGEGLTAALFSGEQVGMAVSQFLLDDRNPRHLVNYSEWVKNYFTGRYNSTPDRETFKFLCGY